MASRTTSRQGATASKRGRAKPAASASRPRARNSSPSRKPARTNRSGLRLGWVAPVAIAALIVVAAWSFYPVARMQYREQREKQRLEQELTSLKERNSKLRAEVDRLKTPEGVEEVARESLGLVKEGENLYVVVDEQSMTATTTAAPDTAPKASAAADEANGWQQALDLVFGFE